MGAAAFLLAVLWTIVRTKEYPPSDSERERLKTAKAFDPGQVYRAMVEMPEAMRQLAAVQFVTWVGIILLVPVFFSGGGAQCFRCECRRPRPLIRKAFVWAGYCSAFYSVVCAVDLAVFASHRGARRQV